MARMTYKEEQVACLLPVSPTRKEIEAIGRSADLIELEVAEQFTLTSHAVGGVIVLLAGEIRLADGLLVTGPCVLQPDALPSTGPTEAVSDASLLVVDVRRWRSLSDAIEPLRQIGMLCRDVDPAPDTVAAAPAWASE